MMAVEGIRRVPDECQWERYLHSYTISPHSFMASKEAAPALMGFIEG